MNAAAVNDFLLSLNCAPLSSDPVKVSGGDIHQTYVIESGEQQFFIKVNHVDSLAKFECEHRGLLQIEQSRSIRVPRVLGSGIAGNHAVLAMEFIELGNRLDPVEFGRRLAAMHHCCAPNFGFEQNNFIGSSLQRNDAGSDWVEFWQNMRLMPQLKLAETNKFDAAGIDRGYRLSQTLGCFFERYVPLPSLLHGDLWSGNWGSDALGAPVVYDPACYYGDHEADLALMELFGQPGDNFFSSYKEQFVIDADYPVRRQLYNLYHILNHANMFGGGYIDQSFRMIDQLLAEI
ncbi:MAG: protein-ribulosamine 3-kinase [Gammaproteobacteria bacterium]|jgi:protein-ribulosamine 3-kinase